MRAGMAAEPVDQDQRGRGRPSAGEAFRGDLPHPLATMRPGRRAGGFKSMERQEPTIGKPDMQNLHFRPRHKTAPIQRHGNMASFGRLP